MAELSAPLAGRENTQLNSEQYRIFETSQRLDRETVKESAQSRAMRCKARRAEIVKKMTVATAQNALQASQATLRRPPCDMRAAVYYAHCSLIRSIAHDQL